jgi:hypothetical protein
MSKRLSAIIAAATLGLSAAALAQTGTPTTPNPSTAPTPRSGTMPQSGTTMNKQMSEAEVRQELQNQGYTNISNLKKKGTHYEAKGMKDGKNVSLNVDAKSGKVVAR